MVNKNKKLKQHQRTGGFTLIELVIVIIVLAILAIIAVSKFVDFKRDAEIARVQAIEASLQVSINFIHSRWQISDGSAAVLNLEGFGDDNFDINALGYPLGTEKGRVDRNANIGPGQQGCIDLWDGLLVDPPTVSIRNSSGDTDFESYRHDSSSKCTYVLRTLGDTAGRNRAEIKIVYDSVVGTVETFISD